MIPSSEKEKFLRLDRLLANLGYGSRRDVQNLFRSGSVSLDGKVLTKSDDKIGVASDLSCRIRVHGEPLDPVSGLVLMVHKPLGVTCSHKEQGKLIYELLPERWARRLPPLSTVGRLDKETSGLVLLTDDGNLLHRIISPKNHIAKRYHVTTAVPFRGKEKDVFASGGLMLEGEDKPLLPALFEPLSDRTAYLTITEGRYHQIRRMFACVNNEVIALHRDRIGTLDLPPPLAPGQYKVLTSGEVALVLDS